MSDVDPWRRAFARVDKEMGRAPGATLTLGTQSSATAGDTVDGRLDALGERVAALEEQGTPGKTSAED